MRKLIVAAVLALSLGIASYAAISASASDRPPDVEEKNWIAIGPNWGFVVEPGWTGMQKTGRTDGAPDTQPVQPIAMGPDRTGLYAEADLRLVPRTLKGFFVAKRDGAWARIAVIPSP